MGMDSARHEVTRAWHAAVSPDRLLLAAKPALAVGIAWAVAPYVPGVANEYPYYAPLGALVSMYPTLMGSARTGLQTLLGLAAGIVLATAVILTTGPSWWSIPVIVGIGVILSGSGWFGAGREYVPMAALFVLIIAGQDADTYSLGYLVQMAVGVVTGLLINVLIAPQLSSGAAGARISAFQREVAQRLREGGDAVESESPPAHADWIRASEDLAGTARAVRADLAEADESRKGNPRALVNKRDVRIDHARLEAMDQIVFHVRDVSASPQTPSGSSADPSASTTASPPPSTTRATRSQASSTSTTRTPPSATARWARPPGRCGCSWRRWTASRRSSGGRWGRASSRRCTSSACCGTSSRSTRRSRRRRSADPRAD